MKESARYKIFVLVGPPSVGKSTWISEHFASRDKKSYFVVSRDDIVEQVAHKFGMAYDDMYTQPPQKSKIGDEDQTLGRVISQPNKPGKMAWDRVYEANQEINQRFEQRMRQASGFNGDIVIDMTNMEPYPRKRALQIISRRHDEFEKIAVVFKFQGFEEQLKANALRRAEEEAKQGKYKTVTPDIMERMFKSYKPVTPDEGFDRIVDVDNTASIQKLIDKKPEPAMDVKTESKIRRMVKEALLKEYFMTKTKTRADLKKLPPKRDQYAALGSDVAGIIKILHKADETANNEVDLIKSKLDIDPGDFIISSDMKPQWIDNLYRDTFEKIGLHKLGNGVARDVFEINDEFVLKYMKPDRADKNQNIEEIKITNSRALGDYITKIYEVSKFNSQWIICERVKPVERMEDAKWLDAVDLIDLYYALSPLQNSPDNSETLFIYPVIKSIIENSVNFNDGRHIDEQIIQMRINAAENHEGEKIYSVNSIDDLSTFVKVNKEQYIQNQKEKLAFLKSSKRKGIRLLKDNKFLQTILRAKKEIGFSVDDLHTGNVGFTIKDNRPIILDAGWSDDF
jgi:predicted kinase